MPAKIVVTSVKGGSKISLLGSSGKELLGSVVFSEPRAKGATLRALKGLLGKLPVEDKTLRAPQRTTPVKAAAVTKATTKKATPVKAAARPKATKKSAAPKAAVKSATPKAAASKVTALSKATTGKVTTAPKAAATKVAAARKTTKAATARP